MKKEEEKWKGNTRSEYHIPCPLIFRVLAPPSLVSPGHVAIPRGLIIIPERGRAEGHEKSGSPGTPMLVCDSGNDFWAYLAVPFLPKHQTEV